MNYCSHCGNPVKITRLSHDPVPRHYCYRCGKIHYKNPRMVVGCLACWSEKVLLCKRSIEPFPGKWNLPAGYLENGETVEEGALRETEEEANAKVEIQSLLAVYSLAHINQVYLHFLAVLKDKKISAGAETLEARLFMEEEIPWNDLAFSSSEFALKRFFEDRKKGLHRVHIGAYPKKDHGNFGYLK